MILTEAFCINLKSRPERWVSVQKEVDRFPDQFCLHRFDAIENQASPRTGCAESHISLVKSAIQSNKKFVVVLEDDVKFTDASFDGISSAISRAPSDWDVLLGGYYEASLWKQHGSDYYKTFYAQCTHCVIYRQSSYDSLCTYDEKPLGIDDYISYLAATRQINLYLVDPPIASQASGYSDIKKAFFDPNDPKHELKEDYVVIRNFYFALYNDDVVQMQYYAECLRDHYMKEQANIVLEKYTGEQQQKASQFSGQL
jgi:GR25 family glycosyltransferase involved in LPS biosynthesis